MSEDLFNYLQGPFEGTPVKDVGNFKILEGSVLVHEKHLLKPGVAVQTLPVQQRPLNRMWLPAPHK